MGLDNRFIKTTVLFSGINKLGKRCRGTGFLFIGPHAFNENSFSSFVVTNKHLGKDLVKAYIQLDFDSARTSQTCELECDDNNLFCNPSDEIDICIFLIQTNIAANVYFLNYNTQILKKSDLESQNISEGDSVYCIGYPLSYNEDHALVRHGIISQIQSLYTNKTIDFNIDAQVFPGNSGSPVILEKDNDGESRLIGIVHEYYTTEIENQIVNIGVGGVLPVDYILETIYQYYEYMGEEFVKEIEILSLIGVHGGDLTKYLEWVVDHDTQIFLDKLKKFRHSPNVVNLAKKYHENNRRYYLEQEKLALKKILELLNNLLNSPFIELAASEKEIRNSKRLISKYLSEVDSITFS